MRAAGGVRAGDEASSWRLCSNFRVVGVQVMERVVNTMGGCHVLDQASRSRISLQGQFYHERSCRNTAIPGVKDFEKDFGVGGGDTPWVSDPQLLIVNIYGQRTNLAANHWLAFQLVDTASRDVIDLIVGWRSSGWGSETIEAVKAKKRLVISYGNWNVKIGSRK